MTTRLFLSVFVVSIFLSSTLLGGQRSSDLKDYDWTVSDQLLALSEMEAVPTNPFSFSSPVEVDQVLNTFIDVSDENFAALLVNMVFDQEAFYVYVNGELIENELNGKHFHADISRFAVSGNILLQLQVKQELDASILKNWLAQWSVDFHTGVVLCHALLSDDSFFGGKLLEVVV